eukprot:scaffold70823_cov54-Phaeocystis_antarctica.AAC.2
MSWLSGPHFSGSAATSVAAGHSATGHSLGSAASFPSPRPSTPPLSFPHGRTSPRSITRHARLLERTCISSNRRGVSPSPGWRPPVLARTRQEGGSRQR